MFKPPPFLPYPVMFDKNYLPNLANSLVYIIDKYDQSGYSINIIIDQDGNCCAQVGDWGGNKLDPNKLDFNWQEYVGVFTKLMYTIKLQYAHFYITNDMVVDIRLSENKFCGPGMLRDLLANSCKVQKSEVKYLDNQLLNKLKEFDKYIIKPSIYKSLDSRPLYVDLCQNITTTPK